MQKLLQEMRLDLGLRSEFEAALRKTLTEFRANPTLGEHTITISLSLSDDFDGNPDVGEHELHVVINGTPQDLVWNGHLITVDQVRTTCAHLVHESNHPIDAWQLVDARGAALGGAITADTPQPLHFYPPAGAGG